MATLRFSDGIVIDTSGDLRTLRLKDGWYVVGKGYCIPVKDQEDGLKMIKQLNKPK